MQKFPPWAVALTVTALAVTAGLATQLTAGKARAPSPAAGTPQVDAAAPEFTLALPDGQQTKLSDYRGQHVILNFWATWCPPCRAEMPLLEATDRARDDLVVVGVNVGEDTERVTAFVRDEIPVTYPVLVNPPGTIGVTAQVAAQYRALALPTTYFIDRSGIIRSVFTGELTEDSLPPLLDTLER